MFHVKLYAGIGSKITPSTILTLMGKISHQLELDGYILRSGGAVGADSAFATSTITHEIFTASDATDDAIDHASEFHPNWDECSQYVRKLHARNSMILLGSTLDTPVDFVICWTKYGKVIGGTGQGLRVARHYNIPIFNLYYQDIQDRFNDYLNIKPKQKINLL